MKAHKKEKEKHILLEAKVFLINILWPLHLCLQSCFLMAYTCSGTMLLGQMKPILETSFKKTNQNTAEQTLTTAVW